MSVYVILIGLAAGVLSGMFGVGGGILFVPGLVLVAGLGQVDAEATSLLAIVPVAVLGAWRQHTHGNVRSRDALALGALSAAGATGGVAVANLLSGQALRLSFALITLLTAAALARRALRRPSATLDT